MTEIFCNIFNPWFIFGLIIVCLPAFFDRQGSQIKCVLCNLLLVIIAYYMFYLSACVLMPYCYIFFAFVAYLILIKFGVADAHFAALKFIIYHTIAIIAFYLISISSINSSWCFFWTIFSFGILNTSYPFNGWIEHFYMHAPSSLLAVYNIFFRPLAIFFMLKVLSIIISIENYTYVRKTFLYLGVVGMIFIPILFFAKNENRRIVAYMTYWQSGLLWLILSDCSILNYISLVKFSILQGLILAILSLCVVFLHKKLHNDDLFNPYALWKTAKIHVSIIISSLFVLGCLPMFALLHFNIISFIPVLIGTISTVLYVLFVGKFFLKVKIVS